METKEYIYYLNELKKFINYSESITNQKIHNIDIDTFIPTVSQLISDKAFLDDEFVDLILSNTSIALAIHSKLFKTTYDRNALFGLVLNNSYDYDDKFKLGEALLKIINYKYNIYKDIRPVNIFGIFTGLSLKISDAFYAINKLGYSFKPYLSYYESIDISKYIISLFINYSNSEEKNNEIFIAIKDEGILSITSIERLTKLFEFLKSFNFEKYSYAERVANIRKTYLQKDFNDYIPVLSAFIENNPNDSKPIDFFIDTVVVNNNRVKNKYLETFKIIKALFIDKTMYDNTICKDRIITKYIDSIMYAMLYLKNYSIGTKFYNNNKSYFKDLIISSSDNADKVLCMVRKQILTEPLVNFMAETWLTKGKYKEYIGDSFIKLLTLNISEENYKFLLDTFFTNNRFLIVSNTSRYSSTNYCNNNSVSDIGISYFTNIKDINTKIFNSINKLHPGYFKTSSIFTNIYKAEIIPYIVDCDTDVINDILENKNTFDTYSNNEINNLFKYDNSISYLLSNTSHNLNLISKLICAIYKNGNLFINYVPVDNSIDYQNSISDESFKIIWNKYLKNFLFNTSVFDNIKSFLTTIHNLISNRNNKSSYYSTKQPDLTSYFTETIILFIYIENIINRAISLGLEKVELLDEYKNIISSTNAYLRIALSI